MSSVNKASEYLQALISCDSGEADVFQFIKFGVQLGYVLPLGVLYIWFIVTILKRRRDKDLFNDSFFTLYLVDGVVTILFLLLDICFFRMTSYIRPACEFFVPLLKNPDYYLTPYYTLYIYAQFAKMLSTLTMIINRYTSVNFPVLHKTIWQVHCSKAVAAIVLIPLMFVWPVAIAKTSFTPYKGQTIIMYEHTISWARTTYGRILIGASILVFTVYSSIVNSSKLLKLGEHMRKVEISMNIATIFVSSGFVLLLCLQISYLVFDSDFLLNAPWIAMLILALTQVCNDFYMLSGPVVLLILDKRIRNSIFCCFRRRNDKTVIVRTATQTNHI